MSERLTEFIAETECLRDFAGPALTDEMRSDGHEYLGFLQERINACVNKSDWSMVGLNAELRALSLKQAAVTRILQDGG